MEFTRRYMLQFVLVPAALLSATCGGGAGGGGRVDGPGGQTPAAFEKFDSGLFSLEKPAGWSVVTAGSCGTLAFLARDPSEPLAQIFYFATVGPAYVTQQQKDLDEWYVQNGGFPITWMDAPVIDPVTPENFLAQWPAIAAMKAATDFMPDFPRLEGLKLVSTVAKTSMLQGGTTGESRGVFTKDGNVGEGVFLTSVRVFSPYTGNPGGGTAYANYVCGVTTAKGKLTSDVTRLVHTLNSFTITQEYANYCLAQAQQAWAAVAKAGQTLSEASDMLWDGWQQRTHVEDITAEKYADAFRGVSRVYDPGTGTVYEVPADWYAGYDANRGKCNLSGLQQIPADSWDLWMKAVASGGEIHCG